MRGRERGMREREKKSERVRDSTLTHSASHLMLHKGETRKWISQSFRVNVVTTPLQPIARSTGGQNARATTTP